MSTLISENDELTEQSPIAFVDDGSTSGIRQKQENQSSDMRSSSQDIKKNKGLLARLKEQFFDKKTKKGKGSGQDLLNPQSVPKNTDE
jgi:hypothetical protein